MTLHIVKIIFLVLHITGGFTALLTGIIPMVAQKGGRLHRRAGWVYTYAMGDVFVTAIVLSTIIPLVGGTPVNLFLLFIGVFSFYFVFSGLRGLRFSRPGMPHGAGTIDYAAAVILLLFSLMFLYFAFFDIGGHYRFNIIFLVFALAGINNARQDIQRFRQPYNEQLHQNQYFFHHLTNMLGSYIAAVTAFLVVNVHFLPAPVVWIGPGLIGTVFIVFTVIRYKKKLAIAPVPIRSEL